MSVPVRMLLLSLGMVLGFGLALSGAMMLAVARDPMPHVAIPCLAAGPVLGMWCIFRLVALNRDYQHRKWREAVDDPASIYARWTDDRGRAVLLCRNGLFLDRKYHAFGEFYSELTAIDLDGDGCLRIELRIGAGGRVFSSTVRVEAPPEVRDAVRAGVDELRASLLS